jgi:signal transduction histidine kinase
MSGNATRIARFAPVNSGLIGEVMHTKVPLNIPDVRTDGRFTDSIHDMTAAVMCVPIIHKNEPLGALVLESQRIDGFTSSHRGFTSMLAAHVAVALYNVRLFDDRQQQYENHVMLRDASLKLLSAQNIRETYALIARSTLTLMRAREVHLYLYDSTTDSLTFGANAFADGRENVQMDAVLLDSRTWRVARTGQTLILPDTRRLAVPTEPPSALPAGSMARVPLKRGERVFGVLIISLDAAQEFDESKIRTVDLIGNQSVIAIENARLFEEVRTSRDQMQVILRSARDGMVLLSEDTTLLQVNDAAEKLVGPIRQYIGRNLLRLLLKGVRKDPAQYEPLTHGLRQMIADARKTPDRPTRRALVIQTPSGPRDVEEMTLPVLDEHGSLAGRLIVLRDISEARAEERFREEVQQMLIHDLRAPASSMLSSLRLMLELLDMQEFTELKTINEIAIEGGERLLALINSLLDIAKADALQTSETTLAKLLHTVTRTLEANAKQANIQIRDLTVAPPRPLLVDEAKIARAFVNLLDNALRHTPEGGEVRFVSAYSEDDGNNFVRVGVIDTGKGIPAEYRSKVFEKFITVPKSALRGQRGTGLGLTFCKRVIEAHNGKIWIDSGPEGGAAFWLTLPLAPDVDDVPPAGLAAPSPEASA